MISWSIFSDKITYMNSCANMNPSLTIRPLEDKKHKRLYSNLKADEELIPDIIFDEDRIKDTYLDKYDGVCFICTNSFQYTWVQLSRVMVRKL